MAHAANRTSDERIAEINAGNDQCGKLPQYKVKQFLLRYGSLMKMFLYMNPVAKSIDAQYRFTIHTKMYQGIVTCYHSWQINTLFSVCNGGGKSVGIFLPPYALASRKSVTRPL